MDPAQALVAGLACLLVASILANDVSKAFRSGTIKINRKGRGPEYVHLSSSPLRFWYETLGRLFITTFALLAGIALCMHAITGS